MAITLLKPKQGQIGRLGSASVTTGQSVSSSVDLTNLTITINVPPGGRMVKLTMQTFWLASTGNGVEVYIKEGSTNLQIGGIFLNAVTSGIDVLGYTQSVIITPSAGSHTYKLAAAPTLSAVSMVAATNRPCFILAELI